MELGKYYTIFRENQTVMQMVGLATLCTLILSGYVQTLLINTCIFGYLSYRTMKFMKVLTNENMLENVPAMIVLLKNWCGFSMVIVMEYFVSCVFSFFFMSIIYNAMKIVGLVLLLQNNVNLVMLYDTCIGSLFNKYENNIDQIVTLLELKAEMFREISGNDISNYNVLNYINNKPYSNYLLSLFGYRNSKKKAE